jgi:hypothetical protein
MNIALQTGSKNVDRILENGLFVGVVKRLHDVRLVCSSKRAESQALVDRGFDQLGHRVL